MINQLISWFYVLTNLTLKIVENFMQLKFIAIKWVLIIGKGEENGKWTYEINVPSRNFIFSKNGQIEINLIVK